MTTAIVREKDLTIKLTITIPFSIVEKTLNEVTENAVNSAELPGFRKGKAPKKLVEERLDKSKLNEEVLKILLPKYYVEAVKEHNLKPVINPKIHIEEINPNKDWQFDALTCEAPDVDLENYKDAIKKFTVKSKIIIPGKEQKIPSFDEIIKVLLESVKIQIPQMLIDQEVDRLLSQLLDEVKKLGLSLDQYLQSSGKNPEIIRKEYQQKAEFDIKIEFVLQKIADVENIVVESKEVDEAITKAKDETEKKNLQSNIYLLTNILRQQKTLDFLRNL